MIAVNKLDAQKNLNELLSQVKLGEEVIIEENGKQVAKIVSLKKRRSKRILGQEKGKIFINKDFDKALPKDILDSFYS